MSKKNKFITDDEKHIFRDAMKEVNRIHLDHRKTFRSSKRTQYPLTRQAKIPPSYSLSNDYTDEEQWLKSDDLLHFSRTGVRQKILHKLKRGKLTVEAQLDLHRMTKDEAISAVNEYIYQCIERNIHCICLIHGKGYNSPTHRPVIKNILNQWLVTHPYVLAFHSAKPAHGGTGAVYVLLKSKS